MDEVRTRTIERAGPPSSAALAPDGTGVSESGRERTWERLAVLLMVVVIVIGAYFRFTGLNWDENHHLHPDERFLTDVASRLDFPSDPITYLRTSESPLNPHNLGNIPLYVYGNFPMTVVRAAAETVDEICALLADLCSQTYTDYGGIHLVGRVFSALMDLISILFLFFIGRRLYDWRVGLLASVLLSLAVMPIQQSHFFTMDNWAAGLTTAAIYMLVRAAEDGRRKRWWVLFGLFLGLTVASRINVAPLAGMSLVAAFIWLARRELNSRTRTGWLYVTTPLGSADLRKAILGVALAALVSFATFRIAQPYAFADTAVIREAALTESGASASTLREVFGSVLGLNPRWLANMEEIQGQQSPEAFFPPAYQWTDRTPVVFPLTNMVLYGMGITAGLTAWFGFLWASWQLLRGRSDWLSHMLPVVWTAGYFLFMSTRWVKSIRYFLPVYPLLLLLGAWALVELWRRAKGSRVRQAAAVGLVGVVVGTTFLWANAFLDIYREPMTRLDASRWMFENVPSGATLVLASDGREIEQQLPLLSYQFHEGAAPFLSAFQLAESADLTGVRLNYVSAETSAEDPATLEVAVLAENADPIAVSEATFTVDDERQPVTVTISPLYLRGGENYQLRVRLVDGGPLVADTSRIVNEEWDDLLPVSVDGRSAYGAYYREVTGGQRPLPWPASVEKRDMMLRFLDEADYIALSSQRSLWNTPRLPLTFPLNIAYYDALFSGELGFDLVAEFHADLDVGPLHISDTAGKVSWGEPPNVGWPPPGELAAEEAFSVYDHPPVWIFKKTGAYSSENAARILEAVDLDQVVVMNPGEATKAPNGMLLSERERQLQRANGTYSELFAVDGPLSSNPAIAVLIWWALVVFLGLLTFPITFAALQGLPDRGYALSRVLALLLVAWFGWFVASYDLLPNTWGTLALAVVLVGLGSILLLLRYRSDIILYVRNRWRYVLLVEGVALALFVIALLIRLGNPDVWDVIWGGEKPMDLSYLSAVLKSTSFPPYDPWYAGGYINYYYFGFVFAGVPIQLLRLIPTVAYNLVIPTLFSFTGLGAFSVAYNLVAALRPNGEAVESALTTVERQSELSGAPLLAGTASALLAVMLGNLAEIGVLVQSWQKAGNNAISTGIDPLDSFVNVVDGAVATTFGGQPAPVYPGDWFWTATRAINHPPGEAAPITEFPFFTFLYGDLHAHMIALPLTLLALAWAVSAVLGARRGDARVHGFWATFLFWFGGALAIGVLRPTNTWDWPTYLLLGSAAVAYRAYLLEGRLSLALVARAALQAIALAALSTLLFWPYITHYGSGYESLSLWEGSNTHLGNYLVIFGLFLFLVLTHTAREFRNWTRSWTVASLAAWRPYAWVVLPVAFLYVALIALLLWRGYWIGPFVLTVTIITGALTLRRGLPVPRRLVMAVITVALGLTFAVEVVVLDGDISRMNTVFKFYMQVWLLLSIAGGVALALAWYESLPRWRKQRRRVWLGLLTFLVALAALYPLLAIPAKWSTRMSEEAPLTLDGMAFMKTSSYGETRFDGTGATIELDSEYEALRWMQVHVDGSPVVAEAHSGNPYRTIANRVAMYTGLPAIVGWDWHQRQQRAAVPDSLVWNRVADVERLYNTRDIDEAQQILEEYDVQYVYVGELERAYYQPLGLNKFETMADAGELQEVFRNEGVTIYRVVRERAVGGLPQVEEDS